MTTPIHNINSVPDYGSALTAQASSGGAATSAPAKSDAAKATTAVQATSASAKEPEAQSNSADLRLVIEDDKAAGCFVYKIVNRKTGEVVQQAPQEQILKLRESDSYLAGDVIKAQA